jgi:hypothetical protein
LWTFSHLVLRLNGIGVKFALGGITID